ncbi:MAG TPA: pyridoxal 5'-phosphate synthase glutaminase subunit PdxT [Methanomassiliicoccales archaeon]|nr:pyridoxal 5'-phosphate synthase glutaminase subunit PdxT [Methanomassiliicoccales archaeon]
MKIGVISVQGAFPEHRVAVENALRSLGLKGAAVTVRRLPDLEGCEAVIIPGGESTTISKLLVRFKLHERIVEMAHEGVPVMGTCAGMVLLAKEGDDEVANTETKLLGLMDMAVDRNSYGRQRESFEVPLDIEGLDAPFPGIFIRAPIVRRVWNGCRALSTRPEGIVMAGQGNLTALSFHPELTKDTRVHEMLLRMV